VDIHFTVSSYRLYLPNSGKIKISYGKEKFPARYFLQSGLPVFSPDFISGLPHCRSMQSQYRECVAFSCKNKYSILLCSRRKIPPERTGSAPPVSA
jgi:hypothetical protein